MILTGQNSRRLTGQRSVSFLLEDCYLDNTTGSAEFGFSGQGHTIKFKFEDGDIIDFNDARSGSGELGFWNYDAGKK